MNAIHLLIVVPFAAGIVVLLLPRAVKGLAAAAAATAVYAVYLSGTLLFAGGTVRTSMPWFTTETLRLSLDFRVDPLAGMVVFTAAVIALLVITYSAGFMKGAKRLHEFYAYMLWTLAATAAAVLADNLILLLVAWEIGTVLLFLLITIGGDAGEAARKTFVIIGFGDSAILLGILLLWQATGTLSISELTGISTAAPLMKIVFILLFAGAAVKAGVMPGHTWIPAAAETAPVPVMAYLPASIDKLLGIYLLVRVGAHMLVPGSGLRLFLLVIGAVTILLAVMMALMQHNLKKLLAFHAVSQVGYMVVGIGTGLPVGIAGALFHMLNNAVYKCCLFLVAGAVEKMAGTTDLDKLGGLARLMPVTFGACLVASLAISGVPPLNGFASKWLIYDSLVEAGMPVILIAAMFGSALTLASFIKVLYSVFLGGSAPGGVSGEKTGWLMQAPMVVLAAVCIVFGVAAQIPLRHLIGPASATVFAGGTETITGGAGIWNPTWATLLIVIALLAGLLVYFIGRTGRGRVTTPFVGGELFADEEVRYPGTGFYESIRRLHPLSVLYDDADRGVYDPYVLADAYGSKLIEMLRALHNGVVSTYVAFALVGLGFLLFMLL